MTNLTNESTIHATVMRRVHTIHFLQSPVTTLALTAVIFGLSLWGIGREVWVARVFQNMPSLGDWDAVLRFSLSAFLDTRFIVQALSIVALGALIWLATNLINLTRETVRFA